MLSACVSHTACVSVTGVGKQDPKDRKGCAMTDYYEVPRSAFVSQLAYVQSVSDLVRGATTQADELGKDSSSDVTYFLAEDTQSGYAVSDDGELTGVFSLPKGRGKDLVRAAVESGARRLDCFDGYLPKLYGQHGFVEVRREANWTQGEPDVVFMELQD